MHETRTNKMLRQIKEIAEIAGIRTEQYARVTKKRLDVLGVSRELEREKGALGERVYELSHSNETAAILEDATVQAILGRIGNLERTLGSFEEEIEDIRASASERASDVKRKYEPPVGVAWQESVPVQRSEEPEPESVSQQSGTAEEFSRAGAVTEEKPEAVVGETAETAETAEKAESAEWTDGAERTEGAEEPEEFEEPEVSEEPEDAAEKDPRMS